MSASELRELAERAGILSEYRAAGSGERRVTSDATRARLLSAMGLGSQQGLPALVELMGRDRVPRRIPARRCFDAAEPLQGAPAFGIWANLYSLRTDADVDLGVGNLSDLGALVQFAAERGAAFVGTSPLHALPNRPPDVSPYQPTSRLFHNPLYLDPMRSPEWERTPEARGWLESGAQARRLGALRAARRVDYGRAAELHDALMRMLYARFREQLARRPGARERDFQRFCHAGGETLRDFATFCALRARYPDTSHDWRRWRPELRGPALPSVRRFREEHPDEVDYQCFLQFECDRQLDAVAQQARRAGLSLGLYTDLAVGSAPGGFDTWAFSDLFVGEVSQGAPPDDYAADGQDWGLPPLHPWKLVRDDFRLLRLLLRAGFRHAGMLRIDHILGFVRQFWIPSGEPASAGAYVRFPAAELFAVLAEESLRAGAVVVGEDLGTVPAGFAARLARSGVLSSRVLLFERDARGDFRPAARYSPRALCTANTHDLPPLAAFLSGRDLELRRELGLLDAASLTQARAEREATRRALLRRLSRDAGLAPPRRGRRPSYAEVCGAVNRFLCATPAPLVGIGLDDLAAELEPVNLPGVSPAVFPSWTRRMGRSIAALSRDPEVERMLAGASARTLC